MTKNSQFQSFSVRSTLNQHSWWRHANVDTPMSPFEASLFLNWCTSLACSYSMGWRIGLNPDEEGADAATVDCCSSVDGRKVFLRRGDDVVSAFGTAAAPTNTLFLLKRVCSGCSSLTISCGNAKSSGTLSCVIVFPLCRRLFLEGSVLASVRDLTTSRGLVEVEKEVRGLVEVEKDVGRLVGMVVVVVRLVVESSLAISSAMARTSS